jgi:hypothetical protein
MERVKEGKYGGCILYAHLKNKTMKLEVVLRRGDEGK